MTVLFVCERWKLLKLGLEGEKLRLSTALRVSAIFYQIMGGKSSLPHPMTWTLSFQLSKEFN